MLLQLKLPTQNKPSQIMTKVYKTIKPISKEKKYQRLGYVNNNDFAKMPEIVTGILFSKNNTNIEPNFYKICTLGK